MKLSLYMAVLVILAANQATAAFNSKFHLTNQFVPMSPNRRSHRTSLPNLWMEQRLDNFNPQNNATFRTRYMENDEFHAPNGPLFIFVGGEWTIDANYILGGHIYDMAEQYNATLLYTEHRYYGISWPLEDMSVRNMRFLSVEQGLADLANFIVQMKRQPRYAHSQVLVVGGSYAGSMVTWFRQLYPHLTVGAWASSAPLMIKADFTEYKEGVGAVLLEQGGRRCHDRVRNAIAAAEQIIREGRLEEFRQLFGFCKGFNSTEDVWNAFSLLGIGWSSHTQYFVDGATAADCSLVLQNKTSESTDLSEYARFFREMTGTDGDEVCLNNFQTSLDTIREESLSSDSVLGNSRQWMYQACSEFGWYQTSGSPNQPFGSLFPLELNIRFCNGVFGDGFTKDTLLEHIDRKNVLYGGFNTRVTNVYFTNGLIDPWRKMSMQVDLNASSPADVIPGAAHCQDFESISNRDNAQMVAAKKRISALVGQWLGVSSTV